MAFERGLVVLSVLLCACSADVGGSVAARAERNQGGSAALVGGTSSDVAGEASGGSSGESSNAGATGGSTASGAGGSVAGTSSNAGSTAGGGTASAGTGGASGGAGSGGASGGNSPETGGQGGTAAGGVPPFDCPNPKGGDHEWTVYTLQPGQCLVNGDQSWSGENVCTETTPDDGVCNVDCAPFLLVRMSKLAEPRRIAVLPLFVETKIVECE